MNEKYYLKIGRAVDLENIKEKRLYRFFEMLVPLMSLSVLFLAIFFSWKFPIIIAFFIIIYDIYWLLRTIYFAFYLKAGYSKMKKNEKEDWLKKLEELGSPTNGLNIDSFRDIYHLVILPTFREPIEVARTTMENLLKTDYPKDKMIVVFACEEADRENAEIIAEEIKENYGDKFFKFLVTFHPSNLEGEVAGHGANDAWATKEAKKLIDEMKIPYKNILVSSFDIDACVYPKYFSCLTYYYLTVKSPLRTSFQPIPLYLNNVWETHALSRVFSFTSTYWHTMNQERPEKLVTFSSHSMPFKALNDVGFKQRNVVSDDSRIFWQCFFEYDGDYRVEPIYYPISMDANCAENLFETLKNIYKQQKRWAYGVGEVPFFLFASLKNKKISFRKKLAMGFDLIEGHVSWAVSAILIFLLGWLPLILGGAEFSQTLLSYNLPKVTGAILTVTMSSLIMSIWVSMLLLPPRPAKYGKFKHFLTAIEWVMIPFVMIFFSALPAFHAQMHWLFGRYMGFWVTPKVRK
ncbi:MAG: glycosyltransferase family 2 protein [Candidatus Paceibacterota bacterium]|jgi:cellulose synthase/poly-beta-1,6-N-acetylglucosamine synthase-like glycosyltransferase